MVYNDTLLFIHIPKCAGTSVEVFLKLLKPASGYGVYKNKAMQHRTYIQYVKDLGNLFCSKRTIFTVVRNPYDRCISEYYWNPKIGHRKRITFNGFLTKIENRVSNPSKFDTDLYRDHYIPQYEYLINKKGELKVDKLFYYEDFNPLIDFLKEHQTETREFPRAMAFRHDKHLTIETLTNEQKQRIERLYSKDFDFLNYKRESINIFPNTSSANTPIVAIEQKTTSKPAPLAKANKVTNEARFRRHRLINQVKQKKK